MSKLMDIIINRLRQIPEADQDHVAGEVAELLEDFPAPEELAAIAEGRAAYQRGEFVSLDQMEHELESSTD